METDVGARCAAAGDDSTGLLAEFGTWLDRERGLSPVSVRCYSKQAKAFLAAVGGPGAVSGLDAGMVTAFMVDYCRGRNRWSAKAMVTLMALAGSAQTCSAKVLSWGGVEAASSRGLAARAAWRGRRGIWPGRR